MNSRILWILLGVVSLLVSGCATPDHKRPILQIDGQPISDKMISLTVFDLEIRLKYQLSKHFKVIEGDEYYHTHEYLTLTDIDIHKVEDNEELSMDVIIYNPFQKEFKLVTHTTTEGGTKLETSEYEGNLSRKLFNIKLPRTSGRTEWFFEITGPTGQRFYQSFKAYYEYRVYDDD